MNPVDGCNDVHRARDVAIVNDNPRIAPEVLASPCRVSTTRDVTRKSPLREGREAAVTEPFTMPSSEEESNEIEDSTPVDDGVAPAMDEVVYPSTLAEGEEHPQAPLFKDRKEHSQMLPEPVSSIASSDVEALLKYSISASKWSSGRGVAPIAHPAVR